MLLGARAPAKRDPALTSLGEWEGVFGGEGDGGQGPGTLPTVAQVACGINGQVYTAEDLPGRGQAWDGTTMTYVAQIDTGIHDVSDSFAVAASPLDGSVAIISHQVGSGAANFVQWFQENLTWIRKVGTPGTSPGQFNNLHGVAFDNAGNLYTLDIGNSRVQKWDTSGVFVEVTGLQGFVSDLTILSDGLACLNFASVAGVSIWNNSGVETVNLKDEDGSTNDANAWCLPPGPGSGNTACHIYTTYLYDTSHSATFLWKYTQAGVLVAQYALDLTQPGNDPDLATLQLERPWSFAVSGDETEFFLATQPSDGGANRGWVYKFSIPS